MSVDGVKRFYAASDERISDKRFNSEFWIRRFTHRAILARNLRHVAPGDFVLDAGCGDGVFCRLATDAGGVVVGVDLSMGNLLSARVGSAADEVSYVQADLEALPFRAGAFDLVISSHVVEHLPAPSAGLHELGRVARDLVVVAMLTCFNPSAWALLGGGPYWTLSKRALIAIPIGLIRTVWALLRRVDGPNEGYRGRRDLPHVWRFPWSLRRLIDAASLQVVDIEGGPLTIPYLGERVALLRRVQLAIDRGHRVRLLRWCGVGTHLTCRAARRHHDHQRRDWRATCFE